MNSSSISEVISGYLQGYADAPHRKHPEPSFEVVEVLRRNAEESFQVIANGSFQKPENLDFRDLHDPLFRLLIKFVDLIPDLVIARMTSGFWGARYLYIQCVAGSKSPIFVPTIINLLTDRSMYIKTLVLNLIIECPHLQVPEALPKFEKLSKMKAFQSSEIDYQLLEKARQCVVASL